MAIPPRSTSWAGLQAGPAGPAAYSDFSPTAVGRDPRLEQMRHAHGGVCAPSVAPAGALQRSLKGALQGQRCRLCAATACKVQVSEARVRGLGSRVQWLPPHMILGQAPCPGAATQTAASCQPRMQEPAALCCLLAWQAPRVCSKLRSEQSSSASRRAHPTRHDSAGQGRPGLRCHPASSC